MFQKLFNKLIVYYPKPFQVVGMTFDLFGSIPVAWLDSGHGVEDGVSLDFYDIDGFQFAGTMMHLTFLSDINTVGRKRIDFKATVEMHRLYVPHLSNSRGRILLVLSGNKKKQKLFIPVIIKSSNPDLQSDIAFVKKHKALSKKVRWFYENINKYHRKLNRIENSRKKKKGICKENAHFYFWLNDWEFESNFFNFLENVSGYQKDYPFIKEDRKEKKLKEKYRELIEWLGPVFTGRFGGHNGFEFILYSNDHDNHFHIIHKGKGINARFSFPEMELINYKHARNTIGSNDLKKIQSYLHGSEVQEKLKLEYEKRNIIGATKLNKFEF